ncbi:MAG TPA: sigma-70 family RNA polymerase sigma factor [Solirubrobacterales bacterium]|nr:sigma-70 family RNA polymerase sigma factor [Solirubrobacterales bacterium]
MSQAPLPPFQALVDEHRSDVLGFLRAMVGADDAEDCFQETFMAALRAYPRADARNLRAWIFTIARRKAIDHHRARARRPKPEGEPLAVADRLISSGGRELDGAVWAHVAALPAKQRAAIALRFVADLRYREIGMALDCTEAAARRSVHDGLRNLRGAVTGKESR